MSSTYKLDELARETDVTPRTIRYYVQRGLLPPPDFRGSQTTYGDDHRLRLEAIKKLQKGHLPLEVIASRLAGKIGEELEALLAAPDAPPELSRPLPPVVVPVGPARGEAWERVELVPGVELHVQQGASPLARRIAREILSQFGPSSPSAKE